MEESVREFLATDRCDRCGARALHAATKTGFELLVCNHHFKEHKDALMVEYWTVESDLSPTEPLAVTVYTE